MARSRRKYKQSRTKVQVGLPKKNPRVVKPAFSLPPKLRSLLEESISDAAGIKWNDKGTVTRNYKSFGVASDPNALHGGPLHAPASDELDVEGVEFDDIDSGSDLEEDDLKSALGKKRRDGKSAPLQPLTTIQRAHVARLVEKHGDNYQAMFRDIKLNTMQHSVATLTKLCERYQLHKNRNPLIVSR